MKSYLIIKNKQRFSLNENNFVNTKHLYDIKRVKQVEKDGKKEMTVETIATYNAWINALHFDSTQSITYGELKEIQTLLLPVRQRVLSIFAKNKAKQEVGIER